MEPQNLDIQENRSSYRQIVKATSIFGGVQLANIIINIVRSKFIAVLLGPAGMGINGLLKSSIGFIAALSNFGLGTSAVRNIAEASKSDDEQRLGIIVTVLRRLVWITGTVGAIITLVLSKQLSRIAFGNDDYTFAFIWISITILFDQISTGQLVVLQGLRKIRYLANANFTGALIGLLVSVPIYYFWGVDGIVPAIILTSLANMFRAWYFAQKIKVNPVRVDMRKTLLEGKDMLKLGFLISLSGLLTLGTSYILQVFISYIGGVEQVGLYSSGFVIINTYVGTVLTAMGTDYYPRLSSIAYDNQKASILINQQAETAILILVPIILVFFVFIKEVIILLYSSQFIAVNGMIQWAALGMIFKALSWSIAFIFLAKGASKIFFLNELTANIYFLVFNLMGYYFFRLEGLGVSFLLGYFIYFVQVLLVTKIKYDFFLQKELLKILLTQLLLVIICFLVVKFKQVPGSYLIGAILIISSAGYSIKQLNKRINLIQLYEKLTKKR